MREMGFLNLVANFDINRPTRDKRWSNLSGDIQKYLKEISKQITFINAKMN